jgi:diacylglycerol kinase family enzyme
MLGVGFDAHVVCHLPFPLKKALGKGAYVLQSLREMVRYKFPPIRLRIDDVETDAASVIITKGCLYGGRFRLVSDAVPAEPGFSVVLFDWSGPGAALMYGAALPLHLLGHAPGVRHVRARRIDFISNQTVPVQADGDPAGTAPLSVTDAPAPIHVVMG